MVRIVKEQHGEIERMQLHLLGMETGYQCLAANAGSPSDTLSLSFFVTSCLFHCSLMKHKIIK